MADRFHLLTNLREVVERVIARSHAEIRAAVDRVRVIERRYRGPNGPFAALHRPARWLADQWVGGAGRLLAR